MMSLLLLKSGEPEEPCSVHPRLGLVYQLTPQYF